MNKPTMSDFDGWRNSATGVWYFEHYLQSYADMQAQENGRSVGRIEEDTQQEFITAVRNAGVIQGVDNVVSLDPFEEEREELENED